jgi:hypothetical protein
VSTELWFFLGSTRPIIEQSMQEDACARHP